MKKLVLLLAVVFGVSFVSCNQAENTEAAADSAAVDSTVVEQVVDSAAAVVDSAAATVDSAATEAAPAEEAK